MKKFVAIVVVALAPVTAFADKNILGASASHDCSSDPVVNIRHGKGTYTFKGACKTINVQGGGNTVTTETADELNIQGSDNTVNVGTLGSTNIVGTNNKVAFKKAKSGDKPEVSIVGTGNKVAVGGTGGGGGGGGGDEAKPAEKPAPPPASDVKAPAGAKLIDCTKTPTWSTGNGGGSFKFTGTCKKISVGGGENSLWIQSAATVDVGGGENRLFINSVDLLDIGGAENQIAVNTVGTISVGGADNQITWKKAKSGDKPTLKGQPDKNTIVQVK